MEGKDPQSIPQGMTEIRPGQPNIEHPHPDVSLSRHHERNDADIRTKMNNRTITSCDQQTGLYDKTHGTMFAEPHPRLLYAEIEDQHVTRYGGPRHPGRDHGRECGPAPSD